MSLKNHALRCFGNLFPKCLRLFIASWCSTFATTQLCPTWQVLRRGYPEGHPPVKLYLKPEGEPPANPYKMLIAYDATFDSAVIRLTHGKSIRIPCGTDKRVFKFVGLLGHRYQRRRWVAVAHGRSSGGTPGKMTKVEMVFREFIIMLKAQNTFTFIAYFAKLPGLHNLTWSVA